jgi:hypothetical protein
VWCKTIFAVYRWCRDNTLVQKRWIQQKGSVGIGGRDRRGKAGHELRRSFGLHDNFTVLYVR